MNADPRRRRLEIRTPEGVRFSHEIADPVVRGIAWLIDILVLLALLTIVGQILSILALLGDFGRSIGALAFFVVILGYPIFCEIRWRGQTLGKRLMRLRVIDVQGLKLQPAQAVMRNILRPVDMLPGVYLLGGLVSIFTRNGQRLGDLVAGTTVVRENRALAPDLSRFEPPRYNTLREQPSICGALRNAIRAPEAAVLLRSLIRRDELDAEARVKLFAEFSADIRRRVTLPSDLTANVADEQFIRNVVDVLYATKA